MEVLEQVGIEGADQQAAWIVETATGISPVDVVLARSAVDDESVGVALDMAHRRAAGEPLQYATGLAGFRNLDLEVGPGVLIPRPETELVAERALARLPEGGLVVDVGTGSGAIALAIADERPDARVIGTDISSAALEWATKNRDGLELVVDLVAGDLLDAVSPDLRGHLDVVVSNPPYVAEGDAADLPAEIRDYEPPEALFAGADGLSVIRRLVSDARSWLAPGGWLVLEISETSADDVDSLLQDGGYVDIEIHYDLADKPRIAEGRAP